MENPHTQIHGTSQQIHHIEKPLTHDQRSPGAGQRAGVTHQAGARRESSVNVHDPRTHVKAGVQCISGGISAAVAMVFVYPLDVVKTKLQTFGHLYKGGLHSLVVEWRAGGTRAIYRGLTPATLGSGAESCAYFMWHGVWQDVVRSLAKIDCTDHMLPRHNMLAGQMTGVTISLMMTPVELVKCRLQALREVAGRDESSGKRPFPTPYQLSTQIYREEGLRGLYTGFVGVFTKMVLGFGAMFGTYDLIRSNFVKEGQTKDQIGDVRTMMSGAVGGVVYWAVAYPLDLVKSRMQVNPEFISSGRKSGFYKLCYRALRTEGVVALYNGFSVTALRAVIAFSLTFALYERLRSHLMELIVPPE